MGESGGVVVVSLFIGGGCSAKAVHCVYCTTTVVVL